MLTVHSPVGLYAGVDVVELLVFQAKAVHGVPQGHLSVVRGGHDVVAVRARRRFGDASK